MSFVHGSSGRVYANGFDLSTFLKSVSSSGTIETHDSTTLGATAKTYIAGLEDATLSAEGLFSGTANAVDPVLFAALRGRASVVWNWLPSGDVDGAFGYGMFALVNSYEIEVPVDDLVSVSTEAQSTVGLDRVQILHPLALRSTNANGTSRDHGVATTVGGVGYLQVTMMAGTSPVLAARIQHSVDAVTWVDLVTFTNVTAANQAQRIAVSGTVNRHTRAIWTLTGTGPSSTFFVAFYRN